MNAINPRIELLKKLKQEGGWKNDFEVPRVTKVVVHIGAGKASQDPKILDVLASSLTRICGQKPVVTHAKKAISNFKIREGMAIGVKVTLRGKRMDDFLQKLIHVTLPRIRDFRGLSERGFDACGNYVIGIREHTVFPEILPEEIDRLHGLEVCIGTTASSPKEGLLLLGLLGFPFRKAGDEQEEQAPRRPAAPKRTKKKES